MPIIKSAKKKVRKDTKRTEYNKKIAQNLRVLIKKMRRNPSKTIFVQVTSSLDKAAKAHLIHANKAARIKSRLSKLSLVSK